MNINIKLFDFLYYDDELPFKRVAGLMEIAVSTLYVNVTGRYGRVLRSHGTAQSLAIKKGRRQKLIEPKSVDWEEFKRLKAEGKSMGYIGRLYGYAQGHQIAKLARRHGYLDDVL